MEKIREDVYSVVIYQPYPALRNYHLRAFSMRAAANTAAP